MAQVLIGKGVSFYQRHVLEGLPRVPVIEALREPMAFKWATGLHGVPELATLGRLSPTCTNWRVGIEMNGVDVISPQREGGVCSPSLGEEGVGCPPP